MIWVKWNETEWSQVKDRYTTTVNNFSEREKPLGKVFMCIVLPSVDNQSKPEYHFSDYDSKWTVRDSPAQIVAMHTTMQQTAATTFILSCDTRQTERPSDFLLILFSLFISLSVFLSLYFYSNQHTHTHILSLSLSLSTLQWPSTHCSLSSL